MTYISLHYKSCIVLYYKEYSGIKTSCLGVAMNLTSLLCLIKYTVNTVNRRPFKSNSSLFFILFKVNYAPKRLYLYGDLHLELSNRCSHSRASE